MMQKPSLYHILTTPESISSLIEHGVFPNDLADYVFPKQLTLYKAFDSELPPTHTSTEQSFIVEVNLSSTQLRPIPKECITRIFVYSTIAKTRVKKLLKTEFNKAILITPALFSAWETRSSYGVVEKKLKSNSNVSRPQTQENIPITDKLPPLANRLSSVEEHISFIKNAFITAKKQIFITSYRLDSETFKVLNLYSLINDAIMKKIAIYFFICDKSDADLDLMQFLYEKKVIVKKCFTLSKILGIDDFCIAIGSFNWLSGNTDHYSTASEGTIVLNGSICHDISQDIFNSLDDSSHALTDTSPPLKKPKSIKTNDSTKYYRAQNNSILKHITTTHEYKSHYIQSLQMATKNIIICTPIITDEFLQNTDLKRLHYLDQNKVEVVFLCNQNDQHLKKIIDYLSFIGSTHIHVLTMKSLHLNTIIVDDNRISEGSFNWVSHEDQQHSTLEVSGVLAKNMVEQFYASAAGKLIVEYIISLPLSQSNSEDDCFEMNKSN